MPRRLTIRAPARGSSGAGRIPVPLLALLGAALLATGCGSDDSYSLEELGEPIEVEPGEVFEVVLDSNATTGYEWQLAEPPSGDVVSFDGDDYAADEDATEREGEGGKQTLRFEALAPGEATIPLEYVFTGGEDRDPAKEIEVEVVVR